MQENDSNNLKDINRIIIFTSEDYVFASTQEAFSDFTYKDKPATLDRASNVTELKQKMQQNKYAVLIISIKDKTEEIDAWNAIVAVRNELKNEATRIYVSTDVEMQKEKLMHFNISALKSKEETFDKKIQASVAASIKSYERIQTLYDSRIQLKQPSEATEKDIVNGIKELQESEQNLQNILDTLMIPVLITRLSDDKTMFINKNGKDKFQLPNDINETSMDKSQLYVNNRDYLKAIQKVKQYGELEDEEVKMKTYNGEILYALRSSKVMIYQGVKCDLATFKDITPRKMMEEELKKLATKDSLTGLNNRRSLLEKSENELKRSRRTGAPLAALMIDIDFFKKVNDTYGHQAGDEALVALSGKMVAVLRDIDIYGRMGGEEFAIVLPETDQAMAQIIARRLQKQIERICIQTETGEFGITISTGITEATKDDENIDVLLNRADKALYKAKDSGRNCFVVM
ncbi:MAG: GGDEF domain-containing protein [Alphaproteobacteria bacterium]|nr:GGDEF domain-containing protein [Alphaproteobacteria bacterium]